MTRPSPQPPGSDMKRVLMVAYHFPPLTGSSGIQRTLRFVQHLPALRLAAGGPDGAAAGLRTHQPRPDGRHARRARSSNAPSRSTPRGTCRSGPLRRRAGPARPLDDAGASTPCARGLRMIRRYRPDAIWSTYPIATAHLIGADAAAPQRTAVGRRLPRPDGAGRLPDDPPPGRRFKRIEERAMARARVDSSRRRRGARVPRRYPQAAERIDAGRERLRRGKLRGRRAPPDCAGAADPGRADAAAQRHRLPRRTRPDAAVRRAAPAERRRRDLAASRCGCAFAPRCTRRCCAAGAAHGVDATTSRSCPPCPTARRWPRCCAPTRCW